MLDDKLDVDESNRLAQHEAVKGKVRSDVHEEIARNAERAPRAEEAEETEVKQVAGRLKHHAVSEVARTENEIQQARVTARISQVIDYIFGLIYGIIALEILLEMLGARE